MPFRSIDTLQNGPSMKTLVNIWLSKFKSSSGGLRCVRRGKVFLPAHACLVICQFTRLQQGGGFFCTRGTKEKMRREITGDSRWGYHYRKNNNNNKKKQYTQKDKTCFLRWKMVPMTLRGNPKPVYRHVWKTFNIAPFIVKPHFVTYLFSMSFFPHFTHKRRSVWSL